MSRTPLIQRAAVAPRCQIVHIAEDAEVADRLASALSVVGSVIVNADAEADVAVILMSERALADATWTDHLPVAIPRLVPIRIGRFDDTAVPKYLRELNWIDWVPEAPDLTAGLVSAALLTNPSLVRLSQQLNNEAGTWERGGKRRDLLIDDYQRARQLNDVLGELSADPMAVASPVAVAFVQTSLKAAKRARSRRRRWRLAGVIGTVIGLSGIFSALPDIARLGHNNKEAIVTAGDTAMMRDIPDWAAANAAALLMTGGSATRTLGRTTLLQTLALPWRVSTINLQWNLTASAVFDHGRSDAVVHRPTDTSRLAIVDTRTSRTRWAMLVGAARYEGIAITRDGRRAVLAGAGVLVVDLRTRRARQVRARGRFFTVRFATANTAVLYGADGISVLDLRSGRLRRAAFHILDVLDLTSTTDGRVTVLFERRAGQLVLADAVSGRSLATADIPPGETHRGAIAPDGRRAIVAGKDGALWTFGVRRPARSVGLPVPMGFDGVSWATDDRIVVFSDADGAQVVYLPRAETLGTICREVPQLIAVTQDETSDRVQCVGTSLDAVWQLPPAPRYSTISDRLQPELTRAGTTVRIRDQQVRIADADGSRPTAWFAPVDSEISAAALSPDGQRILVGSRTGEAAIMERNGTGARIVASWHVPDAATIVAARIDSEPRVVTSSHQLWAVPDCPGCGTDEGLIHEFERRFSGCLTTRQAALMGDDSRRLLHIPACEPVAKD